MRFSPLAFREMDPKIFKKEDAPSCLVVGKSWNEILNKPDFFTALSAIIVHMTDRAELIGELTRETTLSFVKHAINSVLLEPLQEDVENDPVVPSGPNEGKILADAFWDEISNDDEVLGRIKQAIEKAYQMKKEIAKCLPLTNGSTLSDLKADMNNIILKPLRGKIEDEEI